MAEEQPTPSTPTVANGFATVPLTECQLLRDEYLAGWQRAKADYLNLQKEIAERLQEEFEAGKRYIAREILPVLDTLAIAEKNLPPEAKASIWAAGIADIIRDFEKRLEGLGLQPIEVLGKLFDPLHHESLESVPSDQPEGTIVEELQKGYMYKGRVLRPARVKISKAQSA